MSPVRCPANPKRIRGRGPVRPSVRPPIGGGRGQDTKSPRCARLGRDYDSHRPERTTTAGSGADVTLCHLPINPPLSAAGMAHETRRNLSEARHPLGSRNPRHSRGASHGWRAQHGASGVSKPRGARLAVEKRESYRVDGEPQPLRAAVQSNQTRSHSRCAVSRISQLGGIAAAGCSMGYTLTPPPRAATASAHRLATSGAPGRGQGGSRGRMEPPASDGAFGYLPAPHLPRSRKSSQPRIFFWSLGKTGVAV